ncbi:uncharacterized protein BDW47DRAFT_60221 [Aspergillus candidus]|uniref:Uncharacterized protein n=1 Tax=Aspergillus candidus TaxID=41067 RepID=A0A2I2F4U9_ASPCN|nr:hypothetical protein BDW47DRAFT_60221 [Aspergillus candidus]PLB35679.1 hypothetical protein BDW47DRAFT_60221 [Aspergillus candidus]
MSALPPSKSQHSSVEDLVAALQAYWYYEESMLISFIMLNLNTIDLPVNSRTALSYAVETPYTDCVRILLQYSHSSTINQPDATGRTALSYAATAEVNQIRKPIQRPLGPGRDLNSMSRESIRLLIDKKADPRSQDQTGRTPLSWAAGMGCEATVRFFCNEYKEGDAVFAADHDGRTPLSWAAGMGCEATVRFFCNEYKEGDAVFAADHDGRTPLSWAAGMGCEATVRFFCNEYKEDDAVFAADHGGRSPVSYAAQAGNHYVVRKLFNTKKNYDDCDHENRTPLYWCLQERWRNDQSKNKPIPRDAAMYSCLPPNFISKHRSRMPPKSSEQGIVKILNQSVKRKMTLLSEAVMHDDKYAVEVLISIPHFTCDAINEEGGETALILALRYGKKPIFRLLCGNLGESLEQIKRHSSSEKIFQRFLEVGKDWLKYSTMKYEGLSKIRQFLRASLEELLQYKEVEKVEQRLGRLIDTLRVPLTELNWVIDSECSLRETVANIKQISLLHVLLEHGVDPATLCLTGNWFNLHPTDAKASLQLWQLPEPEKYSYHRTQTQTQPIPRRRIDPSMRKLTREQEQSLTWGLSQKKQPTHGMKLRTPDELEHIQCCENSKTTILAHNERDAWENFSDKRRDGSIESRTCHTTFSILLQSTENSSMCNLQGLEQTLWGVQWTIPHENQHNPFYNSSLSKIWIPESISEFLKQFWEEFDEEWERYCDSTETHLVEHRQQFAKGSLDPKHINDLGRDLLYLAHLRRTLHYQLKTIEAEMKRYYSTVVKDDREDKNKSLQSNLRSIKLYYTEKLDRFEHTINSISQMEYTRQSIHEATFIRRISVVTFVYLPLMFTASLFGMNVNATEGSPGWQWFLPFAAGFWGLTYLLWKISGQSATEIKRGLESLKRPWRINYARKNNPEDTA